MNTDNVKPYNTYKELSGSTPCRAKTAVAAISQILVRFSQMSRLAVCQCNP